jgi:hypothetical protein
LRIKKRFNFHFIICQKVMKMHQILAQFEKSKIHFFQNVIKN